MTGADHDDARTVAMIRRELRDCRVVVFDIDGVLRRFDPEVTDQLLERELGLPAGTWWEIAFEGPHLEDVVTGRMTFAAWRGAIAAELNDRTGQAAQVETVVQQWVDYRGAVIPETLELLDTWRDEGRAVFLFTNGTDAIPAELTGLGLEHLVENTINSAVLGYAKPDPQAYRAAHAMIEQTLGHPVPARTVGFADDRLANVEAAAEFGWQAIHFSPPLGVSLS